jgi:hypothetical protein
MNFNKKKRNYAAFLIALDSHLQMLEQQQQQKEIKEILSFYHRVSIFIIEIRKEIMLRVLHFQILQMACT